MDSSATVRVVIRHLAGSKVNQVEKLQTKDVTELTIGRDASTDIAFDPKRDDVVSRKHAAIRVKDDNGKLSFRIADLNSSNGTFLNGERLSGEAELLPEDVIELGEGGPKFTFDVEPRPANLAARTRTMGAMTATATHAVAGPATTANRTQKQGVVPVKANVGKETVMRMLTDERRSTNRVWIGAIAAVLVVGVVGGVVLYRHNVRVAAELAQASAAQGERLRGEAAGQRGLSAGDIITKFGNATVWIDANWRLYDSETSRALFHRTYTINGETLPCYVKMPDGKIVRWLTLGDENRSNQPIGGDGRGSGFVVTENGFILTNKHVAAPWLMSYRLGRASNRGFVFPLGFNPSNARPKEIKEKVTIVDLSSGQHAASIQNWIPEADGGFVFADTATIPIGAGGARVFSGRNTELSVRFPGSRTSINAQLVRASPDSDVAQLKIESPQPLKKLDLATDDNLKVGDRIIVLGYPAVSLDTTVRVATTEGGVTRRRDEIVPEPTVNEGIISRLGTETRRDGNEEVFGTLADAIQLSITTTGPGNSGGPAFNAAGKVVGIYTMSRVVGPVRVTFAVPIKYGRDMLAPQRLQ
jgi:serine protease Do